MGTQSRKNIFLTIGAIFAPFPPSQHYISQPMRIRIQLLLLYFLFSLISSFAGDGVKDWRTMGPEKSKEALKEYRGFMAEVYTWEPQDQITYLTTALEASQTLQDDSSQFYFAEKLGVLYRELDSMELAYTVLTDALNYSYDVSTKRIALNSMGGLHLKNRDLSAALDYFFQAAEEAKILNDGSEAYPIGNISEIYARMEDYENAIKYLRYSNVYSKKLISPEKEYSLVYDYSFMVEYFQEQGKLDSAKKYVALDLEQIQYIDTVKRQKFQDACFIGYHAISEFYLATGDAARAKFYIQKTKEVAQPFYQSSIHILWAEYFMLTRSYPKALHILENDSLWQQEYMGREGLLALQAKCYTQMGDFEQAARVNEELIALKQETFKQDQLKFVAFADAKYENMRKNEEIKALKLNQEVQSLTIQNQRFVVFIISLLGLLLAAGAAYLWKRARNRKKLSVYLQEQVDLKTQDLQKANEELRILNYVASHDLKEPLNTIQSYFNLFQLKLPQDTKVQFQSFFDVIQKSLKQIYTLVEDLANYLDMSEHEEWESSLVDLNQLTDDLSVSLDAFLKDKNAQLINHGLPEIQTHPALMQVILKNVIENGIKFNRSAIPTVELTHQQLDSGHKIMVSDNGIGIEKEFHDRIFQGFKRLHNRADFEGSGMGLTIVKLLTEKLGGSIHLESSSETGSRFTILLPS